MPDIQSRRVSVSIKGLDCTHSLIQGVKPSYSTATLGLLGLQFGIRVRKKVVSVKRKEPMCQICMVLSLGYVGVREVEQIAF